jgi:nucleotide-binding universal stress UspA family protein
MSIENILVPTDFSTCSRAALDYAVSMLNERGKGRITLLHVVAIPLSLKEEDTEFNNALELQKIEQEQLTGYRIRYAVKFPAIHFEALSPTGFAQTEIQIAAEKTNADLIIMGTRGAGAMKGIFLGSNTAQLIRDSHRPLLAIPEETVFKSIEHIVFASKMQNGELQNILQILHLFGHPGLRMTLLHVDDGHHTNAVSDFENWVQHTIQPALKDLRLEVKTLQEPDVAEALHGFIEHSDAQMLVTATHKRNFIERIFDQSITRKLAFHLHVPLLALQGNGSKGEIVL